MKALRLPAAVALSISLLCACAGRLARSLWEKRGKHSQPTRIQFTVLPFPSLDERFARQPTSSLDFRTTFL